MIVHNPHIVVHWIYTSFPCRRTNDIACGKKKQQFHQLHSQGHNQRNRSIDTGYHILGAQHLNELNRNKMSDLCLGINECKVIIKLHFVMGGDCQRLIMKEYAHVSLLWE